MDSLSHEVKDTESKSSLRVECQLPRASVGSGEVGNYLLTTVSVWEDKKVLEISGGDSCTTV